MKIFLLCCLLVIFDTNYSQNSSDSNLSYIEITLGKKPNVLSKANKNLLDSFFIEAKKQSDYKIVIISFDISCEKCQQLSWDRAYTVYKYFSTKGVDTSKLIFNYGQGDGPTQKVIIRLGAKDEENMYPIIPPHPCFSYHRFTKRRCKDFH